MKKIFVMIFLWNASYCFSQNQIWENRFNGASNKNDRGNCITVDNSGNVIFGGYETIHTIKGDYAGGRLIKCSNSGAVLFSMGTGAAVNDVTTDSEGNICYVASYNFLGGPSLQTVKLSPVGSTIFAKVYSGGIASSVAVDRKGNILTLGIKNNFFVILKYTPTGTQSWLSIQGMGNSDVPEEIVTDDSNNVYVTGISDSFYFTAKLDSAGNLKWSKTFPRGSGYILGGTSLKVDKAGNVYVTGNNLNTIKYSRTGDVLWTRTYSGGLNGKTFLKLRLDDSANVYVAGEVRMSLASNYCFLTVKYDSSGQVKWSSQYNYSASSFDDPVDLAVDSLHNVYVTGSSSTGSSVYSTVKYSPSGAVLWNARYTGSPGSSAAIALDGMGGVCVTGAITGGTGNLDILTVKYSVVTGIQSNPNTTPVQFSLKQNYPNPFNPNTVISYQLPAVSYTSLIIYDVLGNEIETLVNEKQNAGSYSVDFNSASLPSGIYFYKLVTEKFSETKKMVLVK